METLVQLLWVGLATFVFVALLRRSTRHAPFSPTLPTIEISDPAIAQRLLFDHADAFSNRPTYPFPLDFVAGQFHSISTIPYGPVWRILRRSLTADILHPMRLGLLKPLQREAVQSLVDGLTASGGEEVVIRRNIRGVVFALMARLCFGDGIDYDAAAIDRAQLEFLAAYGQVMAIERSRLPRLLYWRRWLRFDAAFNRLSEIIGTLVIAARRRHQQARHGCGGGGILHPYVDTLLGFRVAGDEEQRVDDRLVLTEKEMAPIVWEFIVAGAESVASCVEWALAHLVAQPEVQEKLHREVAGVERGFVPDENLRSLPYLRAVILECLRMHPTVPLIVREVGDDYQLAKVGGATAVLGSGTTTTTMSTQFTVMASDIGRNGKAWTDPDEFRPERFLAGGEGEGVGLVPGPNKEIKMMPFGAGRRHCPGAGMGMVHVGCFLAALVREFEWAPSSDVDGGVDLSEMDVFFKVMKTPLKVRITPRHVNY